MLFEIGFRLPYVPLEAHDLSIICTQCTYSKYSPMTPLRRSSRRLLLLHRATTRLVAALEAAFGFACHLVYRLGVVPHLRIDLHAEARVLGHGDVSILGRNRVFKHQRPVMLIKPLAALLDPHIRLGGGQVDRK